MKVKDFTWLFLFGVGVIEGIILSGLSNFAFEVFVSRSFFGYLYLFFFILVLIVSFIIVPDLFEKSSKILKVRVMFMGIGLASFVTFFLTLILYTTKGPENSWVIITYKGPPYIAIMGVPYTTIIWTLFLGSFFTLLERILTFLENIKSKE